MRGLLLIDLLAVGLLELIALIMTLKAVLKNYAIEQGNLLEIRIIALMLLGLLLKMSQELAHAFKLKQGNKEAVN